MRSVAIDDLSVLISAAEIESKVEELAREISDHYRHDLPIFVGVLNGSTMFLADLVRAIPESVRIEYMAVSSYGDAMTSSGTVRILKDLDTDIAGQQVLIVEDIVDTGTTVDHLIRMLGERDPSEIRVASLLRKPLAREAGTKADWVGFDIEDLFVVGYGLDHAGSYRNLPYVAVFQPD